MQAHHSNRNQPSLEGLALLALGVALVISAVASASAALGATGALLVLAGGTIATTDRPSAGLTRSRVGR